MRKFKHWFRHEWVTVSNIGPWYHIVDQACDYPGCQATCLYDLRDRLRYGIREPNRLPGVDHGPF